MSTMTEGVVLCSATAAKCVCVKPDGHEQHGDPVHACDPIECGGEWRGTYDDPSTFVMISPPGGVEGLIAHLFRGPW